MEVKQLEENFRAMIDDIQTNKPKRPGSFITRYFVLNELYIKRYFLHRGK